MADSSTASSNQDLLMSVSRLLPQGVAALSTLLEQANQSSRDEFSMSQLQLHYTSWQEENSNCFLIVQMYMRNMEHIIKTEIVVNEPSNSKEETLAAMKRRMKEIKSEKMEMKNSNNSNLFLGKKLNDSDSKDLSFIESNLRMISSKYPDYFSCDECLSKMSVTQEMFYKLKPPRGCYPVQPTRTTTRHTGSGRLSVPVNPSLQFHAPDAPGLGGGANWLAKCPIS